MKLTNTLLLIRCAICVVLFICVTSAHAADPADVVRQADTIEQQERERLQEQKQSLEPAPTPHGVSPHEIAPELEVELLRDDECRSIDLVVFMGAEIMDGWDQEELVEPFIGSCMNGDAVQLLMAKVTDHYLQRGFVSSRVYVPNQNLNSGILELIVVEGQVSSLVVAEHDENKINLRNVLPKQEGKTLNVRKLEQAVDQLNQVPGNKVSMKIIPGESAGDSNVEFDNQAGKRIVGSIGADNYGSDTTGEEAVSIYAKTGNWLGWNERLTVSWRETLTGNSRNSDGGSIDFSIPYGFYTFGVTYSESSYETAFTLPLGARVRSRGDSNNWSLSASRLLSRDQDSLHSGKLTFTHTDTDNFINGQRISVNSREINSLSLSTQSVVTLGGGVFIASPNINIGLSELNNLPSGFNTQSDAPQSEYIRYQLDMSYQKAFSLYSQPLSWSSTFRSQYSDDALLGSQQFIIGGLSTVRGFDNESLLGDSGVLWRNEIEWRYPTNLFELPAELRMYAGYDHGYVTNHIDGLAQGSLSGFTVGMRWLLDPLLFEISWTTPNDVDNDVDREGDRVWARLAWNFGL